MHACDGMRGKSAVSSRNITLGHASHVTRHAMMSRYEQTDFTLTAFIFEEDDLLN